MAVAYINSATATLAFESSKAVTKPTGTLEGHLLLLHAETRNSAATPTQPAGFTLVRSSTIGVLRAWTWQKIAGASEPASYTVSFSASVFGGLALEAIDVDDNATPVSDHDVATGQTTTSVAITAVDTARDAGAFIVVAFAFNNTGTITPTLTGYTQNADAAPSQQRLTTFFKAQATAGSSGTPAVTYASSMGDVIVFSLALDVPAAVGPAQAAVSFGAAAGMNAEPVNAGAERVEVAFGVAAGIVARPFEVEQVAVGFGAAGGLAIGQPIAGGAARVDVAFGVAAGLTVALDSPALVRVAFGAAAGISAAGSLRAIVAVRFGAAAGLRDGYIGPGTGIVVIGDRDPLGHLREGDRQMVILPWAGVSGMGGLARVLSRTARDESSRQEFGDVQFDPQPDPGAVRPLGRGAAPRYQPPERGSVAGQVRKQRRDIERIRRDRRR